MNKKDSADQPRIIHMIRTFSQLSDKDQEIILELIHRTQFQEQSKKLAVQISAGSRPVAEVMRWAARRSVYDWLAAWRSRRARRMGNFADWLTRQYQHWCELYPERSWLRDFAEFLTCPAPQVTDWLGCHWTSATLPATFGANRRWTL